MESDAENENSKKVRRFEQRGRAGELLPVVLTNTIFNILTLTIYRFWGKTRVRRYLWDTTTFLGDRFDYTGTGGELLKGFLFVFFVVLLPLGVVNTVMGYSFAPEDPLLIAYNLVIMLCIMFLIGVAVYRARRYRLSRTRWRGVRAGQTGSAAAYGGKYFGFLLLNMLTLGWTYPLMQIRLMEQMMNNTWFGDRKFHFSGSARRLYGPFAFGWFVTLSFLSLFILLFTGTIASGLAGFETEIVQMFMIIPVTLAFYILVIPLAFCWYKAREMSVFARATRFEGATFTLETRALGLFWLVLGNILIVLATLGIGTPFAQLRVFRYICTRLEATGDIDFDAIVQSADKGPEIGEGLAEAFDVGAV